MFFFKRKFVFIYSAYDNLNHSKLIKHSFVFKGTKQEARTISIKLSKEFKNLHFWYEQAPVVSKKNLNDIKDILSLNNKFFRKKYK